MTIVGKILYNFRNSKKRLIELFVIRLRSRKTEGSSIENPAKLIKNTKKLLVLS